MCNFFSLTTDPENHAGQRFYFDWNYRKDNLSKENDSHSLICKHFKLNEDKCNKYEYNPLTKEFAVDQINSLVDDSLQVEDWCNQMDFKKIVEPLIIKPIINPLELPEQKVTEEVINLLKTWDSVWASVWDSVWASVWDSVRDSVRDSVWDSVGASVRDFVRDSVWDSVWVSVWASVRDSVWDSVGVSVWAYVSSFFDIQYKYDFSSCAKIWEMGFLPSFDGKTWRLHQGKNAKVVFEITEEELLNK
jgi:hypothetical protein